MPRSLYGKLALALLLLVIVTGLLYGAIGFYVTGLHDQEARQKLHRSLASDLIKEGLLAEDGTVDPQGLEHVIHMLMVINPGIEVYVLDPVGRILAFSSPPGQVQREGVDLGPVRRFLEDGARLPIRGDDPKDPLGRKVFSAAPVGDPVSPEGYVYVVLGGRLYDDVTQMLAGSYVLRMAAAGLVAVLLFALVTGLLLFRRITRRLRRLDDRVTAFRGDGAGDSRTAVPGDEIDRLAASFDDMAKRIEDQLRSLEDGDRMRRELVANVSHDLRTPLAALHGYLETLALKGERLDHGERQRYLEIACNHSTRLGRRVAELFELAKLDAQEARPQRERFSVAELVQDVVQKFQLEAGRRKLQLHTEREKDLPAVMADIAMIERVLENLVSNSLRHTPAGGQIVLSVDTAGSSVRVQVRDTGEGIPPAELSQVFDRFYRCRHDGQEEGTGLGLAIAKRIVDLHGGAIHAASEPGQGAVFTFTLPLDPAG